MPAVRRDDNLTREENMAGEKQGIDLGPEDGMISVTFNGVTVEADLWTLHDAFVDAFRRCDGKPDADLSGELRKAASEAGLPAMSNRVAFRLWQRLKEAVADAKKKDSPDAESPDSTESTPSVESRPPTSSA